MAAAIDPEVVIVGAGAAGLAAARELVRRDVRVLVLEARDRLFGRVDTVRDPRWPGPVERGAEFLHDDTPRTTALARRGRVPLEVVPDTHVLLERGRARTMRDMDEALQRLLRAVPPRPRDRSVAAVLAAAPARLRAAGEAARFHVEGYHAAELDRISAASLVEPGSSEDAAPVQRRAPDGYDRILNVLVGELNPALVDIRRSTIVRRVTWSRGRVRVSCCTADGRLFENIDARACIVTVPVGVLRAGDIDFEPAPAGWSEALAHLEMGSVEKLVLRFDVAFWDDAALGRHRGRRGRPASFWHARGVPFPTFWTAAAHRDVPQLTAWAGGPAAAALRGSTTRALVARAVESLATLLDRSRAELAAGLVAMERHDWQTDPFARGAYSYIGVGGTSAPRLLSEPVAGTLVLAGEAFDERTGTVEGALASGRRAAHRLLRSWGRRATPGSSSGRRSTTSGAPRSRTSRPQSIR